MSYYAVFKPTEEFIEKYKPLKNSNSFNTYEDYINDAINEIIIKCMSDNENENVSNLLKYFKFELRFIQNAIYESRKNDIYEQYKNSEDKTVFFCGWEYSHANNDSYIESSILDNTIRFLLLLCKVVKTPDFFDEQDKFYEKIRQIQQEMDGFKDAAMLDADFKIIEAMSEFRLPDNYDDISNNTLKNEDDNLIENL